MKMRKKLFAILILAVLSGVLLFSLFGCAKYPENYTLEEHEKNISQRLEKHYLKDGETYSLYPIYTKDDILKYFLVEFSTNRYMFIMVRKTSFKFRFFNGKYSIYAFAADFTWDRYRLEATMDKEVYGEQVIWSVQKTIYNNGKDSGYYETDNNGEQIHHKSSPYTIAKVLNQKLYLLENDSNYWYIPAIKLDDENYINLVSMAKFNVSTDFTLQEKMEIPFTLDPHAHL